MSLRTLYNTYPTVKSQVDWTLDIQIIIIIWHFFVLHSPHICMTHYATHIQCLFFSFRRYMTCFCNSKLLSGKYLPLLTSIFIPKQNSSGFNRLYRFCSLVYNNRFAKNTDEARNDSRSCILAVYTRKWNKNVFISSVNVFFERLFACSLNSDVCSR